MKRVMSTQHLGCLAIVLLPAVVTAQAHPPETIRSTPSSRPLTSQRSVLRAVPPPGTVVRLPLNGRAVGRTPARYDSRSTFLLSTPFPQDETRSAMNGSLSPRATSVRSIVTVERCDSSASCGGATPVCDSHSGRCVPCESDTECVDPVRPVCMRSGEGSGRCVPAAPRVLSPEPGVAVQASRVVVEGTARPRATVAVLLDDDEIGRVEADSQGRWRCDVAVPERVWHQVSAAHVEDGVLGPHTEGARFLAAECVVDQDCARSARCDLTSFACTAR